MNESQREWMRRVWAYAMDNQGYYSVDDLLMGELLTNPDYGDTEIEMFWEFANDPQSGKEVCATVQSLYSSWSNNLEPEQAICALHSVCRKLGVI